MKPFNYLSLALILIVSACVDPSIDSDEPSTNTINAIKEIESLLSPSNPTGTFDQNFLYQVSMIEKKYKLKFNTNSLINKTSISNSRVSAGCSGSVASFEIVNEGNGNWSAVYWFSDGTYYLSLWSTDQNGNYYSVRRGCMMELSE